MRTLFGDLARIVNRAPVPYVSDRTSALSIPFFRGSNTEAQLAAMGANGTLFAIVDKCATGCAAVDWHLYRKAPSGKEADRVEVTGHPALSLWNQPNDFFTRNEFVEVIQQHHDLTGEQWWVIGRDPRSRLPLELWPVRPDRMEPVPSAENYLAGYLYHGPDGEDIPLGLEDVVFVRRPNPMDPYRGTSPVAAALVHIESARFAAEWNRNFFRNSAEPGGLIKVERKLSDPEFKMLRMRWAEQHQGVTAAHRVALLEGGAEWIERKYTQKDMQFVELRSATREDIREAFGFPKPMLGAVDDVNRSNAEAAEYVFGKWVIVPRLERIKGALNSDLLPLFGAEHLEFDYDSPVDEDIEAANASRDSRVQAAAALIGLGFDPAETMEAFDLPALAFTPPVVQSPPEIAPIGEPEPAGEEPTPAAPGRRGPAPASRLMAAADGEREDWEERLDDLMATWEADVTPAQVDDLIGQIERIVASGKPADLAGLTCPTDAAAALLGEAMFAQADAAGRRTAADAAVQGVTIDPVTPIDPGTGNRRGPVRALFVAGLAADLLNAAAVTASFLGQGFSLSAGREALRQWSPTSTAAQVAQAVRDHLGRLTGAALRDELGGQVWAAENEGRSATFEQAEADGKKPAHYLADEVRDSNTCKPCKDIDGSHFRTLDDAQRAYPFGGFRRCDGRQRCRGTYWATWD